MLLALRQTSQIMLFNIQHAMAASRHLLRFSYCKESKDGLTQTVKWSPKHCSGTRCEQLQSFRRPLEQSHATMTTSPNWYISIHWRWPYLQRKTSLNVHINILSRLHSQIAGEWGNSKKCYIWKKATSWIFDDNIFVKSRSLYKIVYPLTRDSW